MLDDDMKDQMPLFGALPSTPEKKETTTREESPAPAATREVPSSPAAPSITPAAKPLPSASRKKTPTTRTLSSRTAKSKPSAKQPAKVSGAVPEGDVRLTANIRQDLHLKLKIAAAHQRTTIGELIEGLVERYL